MESLSLECPMGMYLGWPLGRAEQEGTVGTVCQEEGALNNHTERQQQKQHGTGGLGREVTREAGFLRP